MMVDVKVKLKQARIRELLKSNPVQSMVAQRAARIARAAGAGFEAVVKPHKFTSRAFVQTTDAASRRRQANDAVLERSLDAAR